MRGKKGLSPEVSEYFRKLGERYGSLGGRASADSLTAAQRKKRAVAAGKGNLTKLTPSERSARAKKAAQARWAKKKAGK